MINEWGMGTLAWRMSPSIGKLVESLAKAQLAYDPALKDTKNPAYTNSKYADLASIISATQPHLAAEGVAVIQMPHSEFGEGDAKKITVTTMLAHSSGEWIASDLTLPAMMREKFDSQSCGSAITYAKRYGYSAMTGVAPEEDDDGNKASGVGSKEAAHAVATEKLKAHANGSETVSLTEVAGEMLELGGHGLSIIKAVTSNATKAFLDWVEIGGVVRIPLANKGEFLKLCHLHSVGTVTLNASTHKTPEDLAPLLEASIQQQIANKAAGVHGPLPDPVIESAKVISSKKTGKSFMAVVWDGKKASCWDAKAFPFLESAVGKPAWLTLETKGQYTNVIGIERLNGEDFSDEQYQQAPLY